MRKWIAEKLLRMRVKTEDSFTEGVLKRVARMVERGAMETKEAFYTQAGVVDVIVRFREEASTEPKVGPIKCIMEAQVAVPRLPHPISKESMEQLAYDALHGGRSGREHQD